MAVEQQGSYASAFLSYTWDDDRFVHAIADELGRAGVLPWLDANHMRGGNEIHAAVCNAIRAQKLFVLILSPRTKGKRWLEAEIAEAFRSVPDRMVPVCLDGRPEDLFRQHSGLDKWLELDKARAAVTGSTPKEIARKVALATYERCGVAEADNVVVYFDQRGHGLRAGPPLDMPPKLMENGYPTLIFRNDRGPRDEAEILDDTPWRDYQNDMRESLKLALPNRRERTIHICGNAQLSLPWVFGQLVAGKDTVLKGYPIRELYQGAEPVDSVGWSVQQDFIAATPADNPPGALGDSHLLLPGASTSGRQEVALLIGPQRYITDAVGYVNQTMGSMPLIWLRTGDVLESADAKEVATRIVHTLQRLKNRGIGKVHLLNCLPFHACPLVAKYACRIVNTLSYHEYRRDREDMGFDPGDMYTPLSFAAEKSSPTDKRQLGAI